ncbi:MAG: hypothetical protein U9N33_04685 [Campylobacterota bacterium]|nr:hypothetical protein [Campylobacterota bacterium]
MSIFHKKGIALFITLLFIMLITISIGVGLKQVNEASKSIRSENFLFQTNIILDDVLMLLETSKELEAIKTSDDFAIFLAETSTLPFESSGVKVSLDLQSARSKFDINSLMTKDKVELHRVNALKRYLSSYMININFVDIMLDLMGGVKEDISYNSDIFNEKPYLYRDYIASQKHFDELKDFYRDYYHDNSLKNINFEELFYFTNNDSYIIDLNYATPDIWELMLGVDKLKAQDLNLNAGAYTELADLNLQNDQLELLKKFETSFYEPYLDVVVEIIEDELSAIIRFEYDIQKREGSNFVYEI